MQSATHTTSTHPEPIRATNMHPGVPCVCGAVGAVTSGRVKLWAHSARTVFASAAAMSVRLGSRRLTLTLASQKPAAGVDSSGRRKWDVEAHTVRDAKLGSTPLTPVQKKQEEERMSTELEQELAASGCMSRNVRYGN